MVATAGGNPTDERAVISLRVTHCQAARPAGGRSTNANFSGIGIHMRECDVVTLSLSARDVKQKKCRY